MLLSQIETSSDEAAAIVPSSPANNAATAPTLDSLSQVGSFFPFSRRPNAGPVTAALLISSLSLNQSFQSTEIMLDSQSILNAPD